MVKGEKVNEQYRKAKAYEREFSRRESAPRSSHCSSSTFARELQSDPLSLDSIYKYGLEYHRRCEAFDQANLTAKKGPIAMPANAKESALMNRNARLVKRKITEQILRDGHCREWGQACGLLQQAICDSAHEFEKEMQGRS